MLGKIASAREDQVLAESTRPDLTYLLNVESV